MAGLQDERSFVLGYNEMIAFEKNLIAAAARQVKKIRTYSQNNHCVLDWTATAFVFYAAIFSLTAPCNPCNSMKLRVFIWMLACLFTTL